MNTIHQKISALSKSIISFISRKKKRYIFTGIIHPQRADVYLPKLKVHFKDTFHETEGFIESSSVKSLITVVFEVECKECNILYFRNVVRDTVATRAHFLGFTNGCGYDVEIDRVLLPDSEVIVFGVDFAALQEKIKQTRPTTLILPNIIGGNATPFVSIILSDFNRALTDARNLLFYCYRCNEAIMQFFNKELNNEKNAWEKMRETLKVDRKDINFIKKLGDPIRHGRPVGMTDVQGIEAVTKTWDILLKFFEYLSINNKGTL